MVETIPVMKPQMPLADAVLPYLRIIDHGRWYSNGGPLVQEVECRFAEYLGVHPEQVVAVSNGTLALMGAIQSSPEAAWLCPAYTFAATPLAIVQARKHLVFRDISLESRLIQFEDSDHRSASAVVPVLPFGAGLKLSDWETFESKRIVFDAAASLGSCESQLSELPETWAVCFSLHATKVLPAGEGGLVAFGSLSWARRVREWINFGFSGTRRSLTTGLNAKFSEIAAAYALASLDGMDMEFKEWMTLRSWTQVLSGEFRVRDRSTGGTPNPYWVVEFESPEACSRTEEGLAAEGVESRKWWGDCSTMPAFEKWTTDSRGFPNSAFASNVDLGLPFYRGMTLQEFRRVSDSVSLSLDTNP